MSIEYSSVQSILYGRICLVFFFFNAKFLHSQFNMPSSFKGIEPLFIIPMVQSQLIERCSHLECISPALFMQHSADYVGSLQLLF